MIRPPLPYPDRSLHSLLHAASDLHPERIALRHEAVVFTFRELEGCVNALTTALRARGVGPDDRVALVARNGAEWVIAVLAVLQTGASAVLVNPQWRARELAHAVELTKPRAVIADAEVLDRNDTSFDAAITVAIGASNTHPVEFWQLIADSPGARPEPARTSWPLVDAVLPFSSGTTGLPKAVRHTHASLLANVISWKSAALIKSTDRLLFFFPLFHVYGVMTVFTALAACAPLTVCTRFDLDGVLDIVERERITVSFAAAPVAVALAEHPGLEARDLHSLRYLVWGATPMVPELAEKVTARTGVRWIQGYGASESPIMHATPAKYPDQWRLDSPGLPVSDLRVRVVDLDNRTDVPQGATGEILVSGPQVMAGYLPESANADAFEDGWLRTGDVGWSEESGWIHLTDRAKEMMKVNAFQVAPAELEQVLFAHPAVADCCVYGLPDPALGESPKAAIVLRRDAEITADELIAWVAERVAGYKRVRHVAFLDAIPRTASGKALRRQLRDLDLGAGP